MLSNSLLVMLTHETEAVQADKIAEGGRVPDLVMNMWGLGWAGSRLAVPEGLGDEDVRLGSL